MKQSDYKNYLLKAMGVHESKIDSKELAKGKEEEKGEHHMTDKKAKETATQHLEEPGQAHYYSGMEKAKKAGMFKEKKTVKEGLLDTAIKSPILSPTAIATPVIGVAVRGSTTGGLPSGIDQTSGDISPSRLGGYEKVSVYPVNSRLINKTPTNPEIKQDSIPINQNPSLKGGVTHPHQVQKDAGEPPQSVTGASTDSDDTLKLKSALPKRVDIDIGESGTEESHEDPSNMGSHVKKEMNESYEDPNKKTYSQLFRLKKMIPKTSNPEKKEKLQGEYDKLMKKLNESNLNETFARHKELMKEKLKLKESTCKCGNPDCTCGCKSGTTDECKSCGCGKPNTSHDMKENVGAKEPFVTHWKMDPEKAGVVKVDEKKEGLVRLSEAFDRIGVLAGLQPVKEEQPTVTEKVEYAQPFARMRGLANLGERRMMPDGTWIGEEKWMQDVSKGAEEKGTKGALHKDLGVPAKSKIPTEKLKNIKTTLSRKSDRGSLNDKELKLFRRVNAALNMRGER